MALAGVLGRRSIAEASFDCTGLEDGTPCDDGNACTQTDVCQGGVCVGTNPVVCSAIDQCHLAGTCDTSTGVCSNPPVLDGTPCNDGNLCTQSDTCQGGVCTGSNPVVCTALDECHAAGTCDPSTGVCSNPVAPAGTPCDDGNLCTQNDTCQQGVCVAGSELVCTAPDVCHTAGTCDPTSGICSPPTRSVGTCPGGRIKDGPCDCDGTCCADGKICAGIPGHRACF